MAVTTRGIIKISIPHNWWQWKATTAVPNDRLGPQLCEPLKEERYYGSWKERQRGGQIQSTRTEATKALGNYNFEHFVSVLYLSGL